MAGLLDLPLELREPIFLDLILQTTQQPPESPLSASRSNTYGLIRGIPVLKKTRDVFGRPLQNHAMPLLQINKQIRDEVIDLISRRLRQRVDDAKVDVMYLAHVGLWATWLSVPCPTAHINTLHAGLRSFQALHLGTDWLVGYEDTDDSMRQGSCSGVDVQNADMLCDFLAAFLTGHERKSLSVMSQSTNSGRVHRNFGPTVNRVVVDVDIDSEWDAKQGTPQYPLTDAKVVYNLTQSDDDLKQLANKAYHCMVPSTRRNALAVAESLYQHLLKVFDVQPEYPRSARSFPDIVIENVGGIEIKVGGKPFRSLDLGQVLAELPRREEWKHKGFRRSDFFKWKRSAEEKRKTAGFEVVRSSVHEQELVGSAGLIANMLSERRESLVRGVAAFSEDVAPFSTQPARGETVAFTGKATFIQKDGNALPGNATFYCHTRLTWRNMHLHFHTAQPVDQNSNPHRPVQHIAEVPRAGELVLFEGEAIFFPANEITSGHATFYGRAADGSLK